PLSNWQKARLGRDCPAPRLENRGSASLRPGEPASPCRSRLRQSPSWPAEGRWYLSKVNHRHIRCLQLTDQLRGARQNVATVVIHAQASYPAVENLHGVRSGPHLFGCVVRSDGDEFSHQLVPGSRRVVHHLLRLNVVARSATLNHVAGESEG